MPSRTKQPIPDSKRLAVAISILTIAVPIVSNSSGQTGWKASSPAPDFVRETAELIAGKVVQTVNGRLTGEGRKARNVADDWLKLRLFSSAGFRRRVSDAISEPSIPSGPDGPGDL
jgi:hypothetical protein